VGPLSGLKVVELSNIGPGPFCGMLLADMGADVLRVARLSTSDLGFDIEHRFDLLNRGKQALAIDLKSPAGIATVKTLVAQADVLIEGFRPGVMERLGLGPDICQAINPALIYGRLTGWGQNGSMSTMAGHDINYIALTGALAAIGERNGKPVPPLNLVGDFASGSLYLTMGILAALIETRQSGKGQVVDAAMVDGSAHLMVMHHGYRQAGLWHNERGANTVDGGSPYYTTYQTSDGKYLAVGAVEQRFYRTMIELMGLAEAELPDRDDQSRWDELRDILSQTFLTRSRDDWTAVFDGTDACVSPVLDLDESVGSALARERGLFREIDGVVGPEAAPRFSRTPARVRHGTLDPLEHSSESLLSWGIPKEEIEALALANVIPSS
jgi:alpha-methylacyl-CoA racemase